MRWPVVLSLSLILAAEPARAEPVTGTAEILSGDRLVVDGVVLTLYGVDAPELAQTCRRDNVEWACGAKAHRHLAAFAGGKDVTCVRKAAPAADGSVAAKCKLAIGLDLAAELATRGFALVHPDGPRDYWPNRNEGRTRAAGLWGGLYVTPWDWRAGRRVLEYIADERGCAVKGDIDGDGARRYLLPFDAGYADARIQRETGERWFCDAGEAEAAGWRR